MKALGVLLRKLPIEDLKETAADVFADGSVAKYLSGSQVEKTPMENFAYTTHDYPCVFFSVHFQHIIILFSICSSSTYNITYET